MNGFIKVGLFIQLILNSLEAMPIEEYWSQRAVLLRAEETIAIGGNLSFEAGERSANDLLMSLKREEIDDGMAYLLRFLG